MALSKEQEEARDQHAFLLTKFRGMFQKPGLDLLSSIEILSDKELTRATTKAIGGATFEKLNASNEAITPTFHYALGICHGVRAKRRRLQLEADIEAQRALERAGAHQP